MFDSQLYYDITAHMIYYGGVIGYHWFGNLIAVTLAVLLCAVISYFSGPKQYTAIFNLDKKLDDIPPGMYKVTFYSDGIKKLG